jgi:hypothetical protein
MTTRGGVGSFDAYQTQEELPAVCSTQPFSLPDSLPKLIYYGNFSLTATRFELPG